MKKMQLGILSAVLLTGIMTVPAYAVNEEEVIGKWSANNIFSTDETYTAPEGLSSITMTFEEDGTVLIKEAIDGQDDVTATGTWTIDGDSVMVNDIGDKPLDFVYGDDMLCYSDDVVYVFWERSLSEEDSDSTETTNDKYYTPQEDLVLFEQSGIKVILKGDQTEAEEMAEEGSFVADADIKMIVEIQNNSDEAFNISFGMDFDGNSFAFPDEYDGREVYDPFELYEEIEAGTTEKSLIWGVSKEKKAIENIQLYFGLYPEDDYNEESVIGPIIVHF